MGAYGFVASRAPFKYPLMTGNFYDRDDGLSNVIDELRAAGAVCVPLSDTKYNNGDTLPWPGVITDNEGYAYDLKACLRGYMPPGAPTAAKEIFVFDHTPTPEESALIPEGADVRIFTVGDGGV